MDRPRLRLIHTADWHLGHDLHGISRYYEHDSFLRWLLDELQAREADVLLISGDVFDSANPPASAQILLYRFLAELRTRCPQVQTVIVGGNHDSPARLEAPRSLLKLIDCHVVGALPYRDKQQIDLDRLLVPLKNHAGTVSAWCVAMPFLRPGDLPIVDAEQFDPLVEGVRRRYADTLQALRRRCGNDQALLAAGHCYMVSGQLSELSERKILGGNQHALPVDIFPDDLAYVGLGHLHLAQAVGNRDGVRYSGSPLPLSLNERHYPHQIVQVDLYGAAHRDINTIRTPRTVAMLRVPERDFAPPETVLAQLRALVLPERPRDEQPYLEVAVCLQQPLPTLRHEIDEALAGKPVRLIAITPKYTGNNEALADALPMSDLKILQPEDVFLRRHAQAYNADPAPALLEAFHELLDTVHREC